VQQSIADLFRFSSATRYMRRYGGRSSPIVQPESSARDAAIRADALTLESGENAARVHEETTGADHAIGVAAFPSMARRPPNCSHLRINVSTNRSRKVGM